MEKDNEREMQKEWRRITRRRRGGEKIEELLGEVNVDEVKVEKENGRRRRRRRIRRRNRRI